MRTGGDQRFNLKRRIAREMFINGYRTKRGYLDEDVNPGEPYKNIRMALEGIMILSDENKKIKTASFDHMRITSNPFYRLFSTKTMTPSEYYILLYFLEHLSSKAYNETALFSMITACGGSQNSYDIKTLRGQLSKHVTNKMIHQTVINGRKMYHIKPEQIPLATDEESGLFDRFPGLLDSLSFFSEISPIGCLGYNIQNCTGYQSHTIVHKHHYISNALDQDVIIHLFNAIEHNYVISIRTEQKSGAVTLESTIIPIRIRHSSIDGRDYLVAYDLSKQKIRTMRIDYIHSVLVMHTVDNKARIASYQELSSIAERRSIQNYMWGQSQDILSYMWGNSDIDTLSPVLYDVTLVFVYNIDTEEFIRDRIIREKKHFEVISHEPGCICISGKVTNPKDMIPWLLSLTGYVAKIDVVQPNGCVSRSLKQLFTDHIVCTLEYYRGAKSFTCSSKKSFTPTPKKTLDMWNRKEDCSPLFSEYACTKLLFLISFLGYHPGPITESQLEKELQKSNKTSQRDKSAVSGICSDITAQYLISNGFYTIDNTNTKSTTYYISAFCDLWYRPLTGIELRYLRTIVEDPRMYLFMDKEDISGVIKYLHDYSPLYDQNVFSCFDQYTDGDVYEKNYIVHFRAINQAIIQGKCISILYRSKKRRSEDPRQYIIYPLKLEYSELDNKFRVLAYTKQNNTWIRQQYLLSGIIDIEMVTQDSLIPSKCNWENYIRLVKKPIEVMIVDDIKTNALERFMIAFSIYKKETISDSRTGICSVRIWYNPDDEKEVLCKIRSFGKSVIVLDSNHRSTENNPRFRIIDRLERQEELLSTI